MRVLYLYTEIMAYNMSTVKELVKLNSEVHIIFKDKKRNTPFIIPKLKNVFFYRRSLFTKKKILNLIEVLNPHIVVTSGWIDKEYLEVCSIIRRKGLAVVCGIDNQFNNTFKQKIAILLGRFRFFSNYFSHVKKLI